MAENDPDASGAGAADDRFVAFLRERVGRRLRTVVERDGDRAIVRHRRDDVEIGPDAVLAPAGVRVDGRCTVEFRESAVRLRFDRPSGRVLVALDPRPSRDLGHLVEECRAALDGRRVGRSRARYVDAIEG